MTSNTQRHFREVLLAAILLIALGGCGGSGDPLNNPPLVTNSAVTGGQSLSFAYFQQCINPIFLAALPNPLNNGATTNTCASAGCHDNLTGRGGAFRINPGATIVDIAANTPAQIRTMPMYQNYYSAQAEVIINTPEESLLVNKPLLRNVLHGGGLIFSSDQDPHIRLMEYWITNPLPVGQDEFSSASSALFTNGQCNTLP